jgi:hypothetical protein
VHRGIRDNIGALAGMEPKCYLQHVKSLLSRRWRAGGVDFKLSFGFVGGGFGRRSGVWR